MSGELKYSFDLGGKARLSGENGSGRVRDVMIKGANGQFNFVDQAKKYKVLTRFHEAEKWFKAGVFGKAGSFEEAIAPLNWKPVELSRVELTGEFIRGKALDPGVLGKIGGRISDLTAKPWQPRLHPGMSLVSYSGVSAVNRWTGDENAGSRRSFFKYD